MAISASTCRTMEWSPPSLHAGLLETTLALPHSKSFHPARGTMVMPWRRRTRAGCADGDNVAAPYDAIPRAEVTWAPRMADDRDMARRRAARCTGSLTLMVVVVMAARRDNRVANRGGWAGGGGDDGATRAREVMTAICQLNRICLREGRSEAHHSVRRFVRLRSLLSNEAEQRVVNQSGALMSDDLTGYTYDRAVLVRGCCSAWQVRYRSHSI